MPEVAPNPSGPGAVDQNKAQLQALLHQLMSKGQAPQMGMPKPQQQATEQELTPQGFDTHHESNPKADIGQSMANFGAFVHNMVAQHKQNQIRDAMSEWQGLDQALEKAQVLAGDPSAPDYKEKVHKMLAEDPYIKANLDPSNPKAVKRLKNMYKALNVDMLDDKENVHRKGLDKMFKLKAAFNKVVGAKQKMDDHKQGGAQQADPAKRTGDLNSAITAMMDKAAVHAPDPKQGEEAARLGLEKQRIDMEAQKANQDKIQFKQGVDPESGKPTWFAFDATHPEKTYPVEVDGKKVGAESKFSQAQLGKVLSVEGKPYGVVGDKGVKVPEDPEWNEGDARKYDAANSAYAVAETNKLKNTRERAQTYVASRQYAVIGKDKVLHYRNANELNAHPDEYSPASGGIQVMAKEGLFTDIAWNVDNVRTSAHALTSGFDAKSRAQFIMALRSQDPANAMNTFLSSQAGKTIANDEAKINYLTAVASLMENAMAVRSVAAMGQGSQDLREAILRTIPGAGSSSLKMVDRQLDLFTGSLARIKSGIPTVVSGDAVITNPKDLD
jgi:hypothetical protein